MQVAYLMAAAENVVACETCGLVQRLEPLPKGAAAECFRCGTFLGVRKSSASLHVTAALSLAALVLYVPANIYPILRMERREDTVHARGHHALPVH